MRLRLVVKRLFKNEENIEFFFFDFGFDFIGFELMTFNLVFKALLLM